MKSSLSPVAQKILSAHLQRIYLRSDRIFAGLFLLQWIAGIWTAVVISPMAWAGNVSWIHINVWLAVLLGGAIFSFPILLIVVRPGAAITRHCIAAAQMLWCALLIHLAGGRVEAHFHIFGSLAFLAFYRDWKVLITATLVITADHILRNAYWPQSIFGESLPHHWRWGVHAGWVLFEDVFLIMSCVQSRREMSEIARHQAEAAEQGELRSAKLTQAIGDRNALLAALDEGAIIDTADTAGRITTVNDNFCRISGFTREEVLGRDHRMFNSGLHPREFWAQMYTIVNAGGVWHGEIRNRAKDGTHFWVDTTIKGLLDPTGHLLRIVAVRSDITDRKKAETHLQQAQRLESVGQLSAGIAHEINTPIQYIGDNVNFMKTHMVALIHLLELYSERLNPAGPPKSWQQRAAEADATLESLDFEFLRLEIPQAINQSLEGLARVSTIVRAMKDFSHPGSASKEPADVNRSILTTLEVCRSRWKQVAEVETELPDNLPLVPCFVADLNQVILNLVVNAADAIGEKVGADPNTKGHIWITSREIGDHVEIRVRDDGPGMPEKVQARLFETFFTTKPVGKGTGQGLALSRNIIVGKHGGQLSFESTAGVGTTFIIRLPLQDMQPAAAKIAA